jgi:LacI family transcriptional regulator
MITMSKKKARRVGIWHDLGSPLKREFDTYAGVQEFANEAGWKCAIDPVIEHSLLPESGKIPYDGILCRVTPEIAAAARQADVTMVNVWLNSPVTGIPEVAIDYEVAGVMAAEHLLARGFRQFGFLDYQRLLGPRQRLKGFRARLKEEGFRCTSLLFPPTLFTVSNKVPGWTKFISNLEEWIDRMELPTGIYGGSDLHCRCLINVLQSKGLHVPGDVAIIGSGNETLMCESPAPSLTSIDMGHKRKGYQAAALLERLMAGEAPPREPILVAPAGLIPRQSTDSYAADDPLVSLALRHIAEHGHEKMEVPDVVAAMATTRRTLERKFRASLGRTIAEEITRLRLERAKRRLVETDAPLKEVALYAGFPTANHFTKVFSRVEGISPTQYREERKL